MMFEKLHVAYRNKSFDGYTASPLRELAYMYCSCRAHLWSEVEGCVGASWQGLRFTRPALPVHLFTGSSQLGVSSCRRKGRW